MRLKQCLTVGVVWLALSGTVVFAQTPAAPGNRVEKVAKLLKELRWHDNEGREQYLRVKDEQTQRLLREVDAFVAESYSPATATANQVKAGLDALLNHRTRDDTDSVAFLVNLPNGRFLVIGVEVMRGGEAILEDSISFRAYKAVGGLFVTAAEANYAYGGDVYPDGVEPLCCLRAKALSSQPVASELWFIAWAQHPSATSPPIVTARLFGFDGEMFRIRWTTDPFFSMYTDKAVQVTANGGFTLRTMPDPREVTVINKQYAVTADGPQKVTEWETQER